MKFRQRSSVISTAIHAKNFLKVYPPAEIINFLNQLASDDTADILNELPIKEREQVLSGLEPELKLQVTELLRYEENVAGGLMAKELIKARYNWTVVQCVDEIRKQAENVNKFYAVYVVDESDKLLGRVALQDLIVSDARTIVFDIIEKDIVAVETYLEDWEVAEMMKKYDLESVPVVNVQGQLVGRITIDDVVDVITEQAEEERQIMAGISEDVEEDDSVWRNTRARLPWLLIGIAGGLMNAKFMGLFEAELARVTAIAFFTPLDSGDRWKCRNTIIIINCSKSCKPRLCGRRIMETFNQGFLCGYPERLGVGRTGFRC